MRVPIKWLKEYIAFDLSAKELEQVLTQRGLEVDDIEASGDDEVISIELTPNRGDCASVIGVAREVASYLSKPLNMPATDFNEENTLISDKYALDVRIPEECPLYTLKLIEGISIGESPDWMKERLIAAGLRPLNNVIDITNYIMIETGQPLHAFDAEKIKGAKVVVRNAAKKEEILALDGELKELSENEITIADTDDPIAIGGIIGGENYSITENTTSVLLESAFFSPVSISRSERNLQTKTESSYRFARNVDPNNVEFALNRATKLMEELCSGKPASGILTNINDKGKDDFKKKSIDITLDDINKNLGTAITIKEVVKILESLEFTVNIAGVSDISIIVPTFRSDVSRPIDIVEEIARVYGYENIAPSLPRSPVNIDLFPEADHYLIINDILRSNGYWEIVTHTIVDGEVHSKIDNDSTGSVIEVDNPINVKMNIMRPNLMYGLLETAKYNMNQKQGPIRFFEKGPVFHEKKKNYVQSEQIGFIAESEDFFDSKRIIESIMNTLNQEFEFNYKCSDPIFKMGYSSDVLIDGKPAGKYGVLSDQIRKLYKINSNMIAGFIDLGSLKMAHKINCEFMQWSQFPSVLRDLSLVVPLKLTHHDIYDKIRSISGDLLVKMRLFDVYIDEKIGCDNKSMAYSLEFNSREKTLTAEEIDELIGNILNKLNKDFGITLRPEI